MKPKKEDLTITYVTEGCYRLSIRETFLFFFTRWVPVTYQEAENSDERLMEFETFSQATEFIDLIAE